MEIFVESVFLIDTLIYFVSLDVESGFGVCLKNLQIRLCRVLSSFFSHSVENLLKKLACSLDSLHVIKTKIFNPVFNMLWGIPRRGFDALRIDGRLKKG
jgi:hypothetical protein